MPPLPEELDEEDDDEDELELCFTWGNAQFGRVSSA
jgi:hypothetical protein